MKIVIKEINNHSEIIDFCEYYSHYILYPNTPLEGNRTEDKDNRISINLSSVERLFGAYSLSGELLGGLAVNSNPFASKYLSDIKQGAVKAVDINNYIELSFLWFKENIPSSLRMRVVGRIIKKASSGKNKSVIVGSKSRGVTKLYSRMFESRLYKGPVKSGGVASIFSSPAKKIIRKCQAHSYILQASELIIKSQKSNWLTKYRRK